MKHFRVILTANLDLPDDFEVAKDPIDGLACFKQMNAKVNARTMKKSPPVLLGDYFYPTIAWMQMTHTFLSSSTHETSPLKGWSEVEGKMREMFFDACVSESGVHREEIQIQQL